MRTTQILRAAMAGLIVLAGLPAGRALAQTLTVLTGEATAPLSVPLNRAVVVESDVPFTELSIANPGIADISSLSDRTIYVLGKAPGAPRSPPGRRRPAHRQRRGARGS
jgi:pilus assembly protein CpaC